MTVTVNDLNESVKYCIFAFAWCHTGVINPQDGMKKLRNMEHSTGIWTMRVTMVVEIRDIVIYDKATDVSQHC